MLPTTFYRNQKQAIDLGKPIMMDQAKIQPNCGALHPESKPLPSVVCPTAESNTRFYPSPHLQIGEPNLERKQSIGQVV